MNIDSTLADHVSGEARNEGKAEKPLRLSSEIPANRITRLKQKLEKWGHFWGCVFKSLVKSFHLSLICYVIHYLRLSVYVCVSSALPKCLVLLHFHYFVRNEKLSRGLGIKLISERLISYTERSLSYSNYPLISLWQQANGTSKFGTIRLEGGATRMWARCVCGYN